MRAKRGSDRLAAARSQLACVPISSTPRHTSADAVSPRPGSDSRHYPGRYLPELKYGGLKESPFGECTTLSSFVSGINKLKKYWLGRNTPRLTFPLSGRPGVPE